MWARMRIGTVPPYLKVGSIRARRALAVSLRELVLTECHGVSARIKWIALFALARTAGHAALCNHAAYAARCAGASAFQLLLAGHELAMRATRDYIWRTSLGDELGQQAAQSMHAVPKLATAINMKSGITLSGEKRILYADNGKELPSIDRNDEEVESEPLS